MRTSSPIPTSRSLPHGLCLYLPREASHANQFASSPRFNPLASPMRSVNLASPTWSQLVILPEVISRASYVVRLKSIPRASYVIRAKSRSHANSVIQLAWSHWRAIICKPKEFGLAGVTWIKNLINIHIDIYYPLSELNRRFSEEASKLLILSSTLDPHDKFRNFKCEDVCNLAKQFYPEDFVDGEMYALESECAFYEINMRSDPKFKNMEFISDLCRTLVQIRKSEFFPMLYRLICLVLTIPVYNATTERAFSAMNIIKNKLRSKMRDKYLGDCMVLYIEKEYVESVTNEEVIKEFEALSTRRVRFS
ncbi:hypothetical protein ACLB2K_012804 [Fragaria x ananassa]